MDVLVLNAEEVTRLMPMPECIKVMRDALAALARGEALVPLRTIMRVPGVSGFLGLMPGYIAPSRGQDGALGMKAVSVFPGNAKRGIDTHQGAVLLFEADTGRLSALMDGAAITAIRTAAVSGVATDLLARPDAGELAILGAGVQARTHLEAIAGRVQHRRGSATTARGEICGIGLGPDGRRLGRCDHHRRGSLRRGGADHCGQHLWIRARHFLEKFAGVSPRWNRGSHAHRAPEPYAVSESPTSHRSPCCIPLPDRVAASDLERSFTPGL